MIAMHESILVYRNLRYFKIAGGVMLVSAAAYLIHSPLGGPNGGTWLGYTLGVVAAAIMIWLAWFGIQKRRYGKGGTSLQEWLSAHVYMGIALALVATLHAGFIFGPNIHTLLYILMMIVIFSGMIGVYCYVRYPRLLDREIRGTILALDDTTNALILRAAHDTIVGGSLYQQLRGFDPRCPTTIARRHVEASVDNFDDTARRQLLTRLIRKEDLLMRLRRDVQLRALLRVWIYVHVPFSIAALAALLSHIITVFYYW
jgi:hypothetical protein